MHYSHYRSQAQTLKLMEGKSLEEIKLLAQNRVRGGNFHVWNTSDVSKFDHQALSGREKRSDEGNIQETGDIMITWSISPFETVWFRTFRRIIA